jgi:TonB family protein
VLLVIALLLAAAQPDFDQYLGEMRKRVESKWKHLPKAEKLQATVKFNLDRAGRVSELEVTKSSGSKDFDASVLEAVRTSSPFPPLLTILKKSEVREIVMTFTGKTVAIQEPKPSGSSAPQTPAPKPAPK